MDKRERGEGTLGRRPPRAGHLSAQAASSVGRRGSASPPALVREPRVFLLDEPLSNLDAKRAPAPGTSSSGSSSAWERPRST